MEALSLKAKAFIKMSERNAALDVLREALKIRHEYREINYLICKACASSISNQYTLGLEILEHGKQNLEAFLSETLNYHKAQIKMARLHLQQGDHLKTIARVADAQAKFLTEKFLSHG